MSARTSTAVVVRAGEGRAVAWGPAGTIRIVGDADSTEGTFSIVEATEEPGSAAPLHVHHREAEIFYIVAGELELTCGEQTVAAGASDLVGLAGCERGESWTLGGHHASFLSPRQTMKGAD